MRKEIVKSVMDKMADTDDPIEGSVFEKKVQIDFATFATFMLTQYDNLTMETINEADAVVYLFYDGPGALDHRGSYIMPHRSMSGHGVFGGSRVGSKNIRWNDTGIAKVDNPFSFRSEKMVGVK